MAQPAPVFVAAAALLLFAPLAAAADGESIYNQSCRACHVSGMGGAPKLSDRAAWAPRLEKGVDALVGSIQEGLGAMPPGGGCPDCSTAELEAAVRYMIDAIPE